MLTSLILSTLLAPASAAPDPAAAPEPAPALGGGEVHWFEGTYAEALAKAKAEKKLVFVDFWTDWCGWCKRLDKDTFSQPEVGQALDDLICLSIDAESEAGAKVVADFTISGYPALVIVNGDGEHQDTIGGYLPPGEFVETIARVQRGEGTVDGLRARIEASPKDLELRLELARKYESLGRQAEAEAQIKVLRASDPEGTSSAMRKVLLIDTLRTAAEGYGRTQEFDAGPVVAFLEAEKYDEVALQGWLILASFYAQLERPEDAASAYHSAWKRCGEEERAETGGAIAGGLYALRGSLSKQDQALALSAAEAAKASGRMETLELYARCLHLNGRVPEAITVLEGAVARFPDEKSLKALLEEYRAGA